MSSHGGARRRLTSLLEGLQLHTYQDDDSQDGTLLLEDSEQPGESSSSQDSLSVEDKITELATFNHKQEKALIQFLKESTQEPPKAYKRGKLIPYKGWPEPQIFIKTNDAGHFEVIEETKKKLEKLEMSLVVIGIVGPYRGGKSALMNMIAVGTSQKGFGVDNSVDSMTKGIWTWCFKHPMKENSCVIFMDTEGFGDIKKHDNKHDDDLFILNVLLCSTLIYNSAGPIDAKAVDKLRIVGELADRINVRPAESQDDTEEERMLSVFPYFVWILRDFQLCLDNYDGSPDTYLNENLKTRNGRGKSIRDYNLPRECIAQYFPGRKCFTLPNPMTGVASRYGAPVDNHPEFKTQTEDICEYLMKHSEPKLVFQSEIKGKEFVGLAEDYAAKIAKGSVPCITSACGKLVQNSNEAKLAEAKRSFDQRAEEFGFQAGAEQVLATFIEDKRYDIKYLLQLIRYMMKKANIMDAIPEEDSGNSRSVGPRGSSIPKHDWQQLTSTLATQQIENTKLIQQIMADNQRYLNMMRRQYLDQSNHLMEEHSMAMNNNNPEQSKELLHTLSGMAVDHKKKESAYQTVIKNLQERISSLEKLSPMKENKCIVM